MKALHQFLWIIPFFCFISGYYGLHLLVSKKVLMTPIVIGKSLHEGIKILSEYSINARLLKEKDDADLPEGTIVSQSPEAGQQIKPHQAVFLVVSKKPERAPCPELVGKSLQEVHHICKKMNLICKEFTLQHNNPAGTCIGQIPQAGNLLDSRNVIIYVSAGAHNQVLLPSFKQLPVADVIAFLQNYNISYSTIHTQKMDPEHQCTACIVIDQKPLPGSLMNLKKPFSVQLFVHNE